MSELQVPNEEGWERLNVYRLNADQIWVAESFEDALEGACLMFGKKSGEMIDELCPPKRIGRLERLLYGVELTPLEIEVGRAAVKKLNEGYAAPTLIGVLNN